MSAKKLKAPFPWFGGKSAVAPLIWDRLGDVDNYIEPFAGSLAVLLLRPTPPKVETVNDLDCFLANFWRSTQHDPEAVATYADWPVNEIDLHSRHRYLVLSEDSKVFREKMKADPEYYDPKFAGWWCWGLCCWIGSGWCSIQSEQIPDLGSNKKSRFGRGVIASHEDYLRQARPQLADAYDIGRGVNASAELPSGKRTALSMPFGNGEYAVPDPHQKRTALTDGRGVLARAALGTCDQRRAWLIDWFQRLRDRLRLLRVCCGDWTRVCSSPSVTTRLGVTGVFLDPPYSAEAGRDNTLYAQESATVAHDVREWCVQYGADPMMRICLAGYAGEGHEQLEKLGWEVVEWKAQGGYGNRSQKGKDNAAKERLWFSPHCLRERGLFD